MRRRLETSAPTASVPTASAPSDMIWRTLASSRSRSTKIALFLLLTGLFLLFGLTTNLPFVPVTNFQTGTGTTTVSNTNTDTGINTDTDTKPPFCNHSQIRRGQWIRNDTNNSNNSSWINVACRNLLYLTSSRFENYEWQPDDHVSSACKFIPWDKTQFCTLLEGAPTLIVGDSLSFEHFQTLVDALGGETSNRLQMISLDRNMTIVAAVCDDHQHHHDDHHDDPPPQTVVMYRRLDDLNSTTLETTLNEHFPIVLILNRGAHRTTDEDLSLGMTQTLKVVARWQKQCKEIYGLRCHFFWRTTVPGHPDCKRYDTPINDLSRMEALIAAHNDARNYHWNDFKHQNQIVENQLSSISSSSSSSSSWWSSFQQNNNDDTLYVDSTILDAYHLNILRPDQHQDPSRASPNGRPSPDCLHSCLPGKVQVYNRLLLHWLTQSRTMEDVEVLQEFNFPWNRTSNFYFNGTNGLVHPP